MKKYKMVNGWYTKTVKAYDECGGEYYKTLRADTEDGLDKLIEKNEANNEAWERYIGACASAVF